MKHALWLGAAVSACAARVVSPSPTPVPTADPPRAAASVPAPVDAGPLPSQSKETRIVARMLRRVEAARGLASIKLVPGVRLARSDLIAQVKAHVSRELPPKAIHNEGLALQLFGFIPTRFDYEGAEYRLLEEQLAGYYEPSDGTMYLASDLATEDANATLAHELVHALQDQRWHLEERSKYRPGDGDRSEAFSALAEGDATSAMFDVMIARADPHGGKTAISIPDQVFVEQIRAGMSLGPGADTPRVMRSSLAAPYIYGTLFVNALRRRGGWAAVDGAWDDAPTTTEQILHVEKWDVREPPQKVTPPPFATLGGGWHVEDEDSEGELGARIAFEEWMDATTAATVSSGWGGDRGVLLASGDAAAFAWRLRYDAGATPFELSKRAYEALDQGWDQSLGPPNTRAAAFVCRERADRGPIAIGLAANDVIMVLGPAKTSGPSWTSASSCAKARQWVREIAAAAP